MDDEKTIKAVEVSNYVVCPEAWRLKRELKFHYHTDHQADASSPEKRGEELRKEWVKSHDLSAVLRYYAKIAYCLLLLLVIVVFIWDLARHPHSGSQTPSPTAEVQPVEPEEPEDSRNLLSGPKTAAKDFLVLVATSKKTLPTEIIFLLLVLGLLIFLWDLFDRRSKNIQQQGGLDENVTMVALHGSDHLPSKDYYSERLGLSSRPDALVKDEGFFIPVDRKPTTKKIRDRHIVHLLVHLRLLEEVEGKRPPYGILLMGPNVRTVRVKNTDERQRWLDTLLDEMRSIVDGVPAVAAPSKIKCKHCDVRKQCKFTAYHDHKPAPAQKTKED